MQDQQSKLMFSALEQYWQSLLVFMDYSFENTIFVLALFATSWIIFFLVVFYLLGFRALLKLERFTTEEKPERYYLNPNVTIEENAFIHKLIKNKHAFDRFEIIIHRFGPLIIKIRNAGVHAVHDIFGFVCWLNTNFEKLIYFLILILILTFSSVGFVVGSMGPFTVDAPHPHFWKYEVFGLEEYNENWLDT